MICEVPFTYIIIFKSYVKHMTRKNDIGLHNFPSIEEKIIKNIWGTLANPESIIVGVILGSTKNWKILSLTLEFSILFRETGYRSKTEVWKHLKENITNYYKYLRAGADF